LQALATCFSALTRHLFTFPTENNIPVFQHKGSSEKRGDGAFSILFLLEKLDPGTRQEPQNERGEIEKRFNDTNEN